MSLPLHPPPPATYTVVWCLFPNYHTINTEDESKGATLTPSHRRTKESGWEYSKQGRAELMSSDSRPSTTLFLRSQHTIILFSKEFKTRLSVCVAVNSFCNLVLGSSSPLEVVKHLTRFPVSKLEFAVWPQSATYGHSDHHSSKRMMTFSWQAWWGPPVENAITLQLESASLW